ncbi:MAG: hypothetical protein ABFR05_07870 [Bacteroidota bacterium]
MKALKILLIAIVISTLSVSVTAIAQERPTEALCDEIVDLIGPDCPYNSDKKEFVAEVRFTLNDEGEIVIISVKSPNPKAESYLMSKLNNKKLDSGHTIEGKKDEVYLFPVRIVKLF